MSKISRVGEVIKARQRKIYLFFAITLVSAYVTYSIEKNFSLFFWAGTISFAVVLYCVFQALLKSKD